MKGYLKAICAAFLIIMGVCYLWRTLLPLPGSYNRGENGLWLGLEWFQGSPPPIQWMALQARLSSAQIRYLFVYTTWITADGTPSRPIPEDAHHRVQQLRSLAPQSRWLAWIGIPTTTLGRGAVDLANPEIRTRIAEFCGQLVKEIGFDGVHLDVEPVPDGSQDFLRLLEEVGAVIGSEALLSIAGEDFFPHLLGQRWPYLHQIKWSTNYYEAVAQQVDQIAVMMYDSMMPLGIIYEIWLSWQVTEITRAVQNTDVFLLFGIATYEEITWTHMPWAENIETGLRGVRRGIGGLPEELRKRVQGVGLYAEWTIDEVEWKKYEQLWLEK